MKQLLILSGKGGTGKTTVAKNLIEYGDIHHRVDCDIDAPNLHEALGFSLKESRWDKAVYHGMPKASICQSDCQKCGRCFDLCQFDAIKKVGDQYRVDPIKCEGCGLCEWACEAFAVSFIDHVTGHLFIDRQAGIFSTGQLKMGSGNSGKLVAAVKTPIQEMKQEEYLGKRHPVLTILDGSPGIGCPVIASISGVDGVLFVAEPSQSGLHDLKRVIKMAAAFQPVMAVCINRYDLNLKATEEIKAFCKDNALPCIGCLPYETKANKSLNEEEKSGLSNTFNNVIGNIYDYFIDQLEV